MATSRKPFKKDVLLENEKRLGLLAKWNLTRRQTNTRNEISRLEAEMRERVEKGSQTTGVLGPNDCRGWATQLRLLIAESLTFNEGEDEETRDSSAPFDWTIEKGVTPLGVGDTMLQTLVRAPVYRSVRGHGSGGGVPYGQSWARAGRMTNRDT